MVYFHTGGAANNTLVIVALADGFFEAGWDIPHPAGFTVAFVLGAAGAAWGGELQAFVVAGGIIPLV